MRTYPTNVHGGRKGGAWRKELSGKDSLKAWGRVRALDAITAFAPPDAVERVERLTGRQTAKEEKSKMAKLREVCGVWRKSGKSGTYYSGKTKEEIRIPVGSYVNVFKNEDANEENGKPQLKITFSTPDGE